MRARELSFPVTNAKWAVKAVVEGVLKGAPAKSKPSMIAVQQGNRLSLVDTVEVVLAYAANPETRMGSLPLQDVVFKTANGRISERLLDDLQVGNQPWGDWVLIKSGKKVLLCEVCNGFAHCYTREATYYVLSQAAPQCVCPGPERHAYRADQVPENRLCETDGLRLVCMG